MSERYKAIEQAKELLKKEGYFSLWWQEADIIEKCDEMKISYTDKDIKQIANMCEKLGADVGINWESIEEEIKVYFTFKK